MNSSAHGFAFSGNIAPLELQLSRIVDASTVDSFDRLTRLAAHLLQVPLSALALVENQQFRLQSQFGFAERGRALEAGETLAQLFAAAPAVGKALAIDDLTLHEEFATHELVASVGGRSFLGTTLSLVPEGVVAWFGVFDRHPRQWNEDDHRLLVDVARLVAAELQLRVEVIKRRRAERTLQDSQSHLAETLKSARLGYWCRHFPSERVSWSDELYEMFGLSREAFGENYAAFIERVHPDDRQRVTGELELAIRHRLPFEHYYRISVDGFERVIYERGNVVCNDEGEIVRIFGSAQDVTEEWGAEQAVRESEERFRLLFERARDAIMIIDDEGTHLDANPQAEILTGYERDELLGMRLVELAPPESAVRFRQLFADFLREGQMYGEYVLQKKDGTSVDVEFSANRMRDGVHQTIMRDITDRKRAQRMLQESEDRFRQSQKMEAIGRLAGGVAHDFNNLLTVIGGYSDVGLEMVPTEDPLHDMLREIKNAGERAARLTRQLLAFSRKQILDLRPLNLNSVVADLQSMLRRLIGEDIEFQSDLDSNLGTVRADVGQMEQVIVNLVINARDAMPSGGKLIVQTENVELKDPRAMGNPQIAPGPYVLLSVIDTGYGMDDVTKARIFEPFFTTKAPGQGTGLGLPMVYGAVTQSGGCIHVYSEPDHGTSMKIYLPRADELEAGETESGEPSPGLLGGKETILLVEDEEGVRTLARNVLEASGYRVIEARNGLEALEVSRHYPDVLDLLLTDVVMPRMGGRELADQLASSYPQMPVLYVSGYIDDAVLRHGVQTSERSFLQKPYTPLQLAKKVREVLDAAASRRA